MRQLALVIMTMTMTACYSQNILEKQTNLMQPGDGVTMIELEYIDAGESGNDMVWDFSGLETLGSSYIKYDTITDHQIVSIGQKYANKFRMANDSMLITSYESPLTTIDYQRPQLQLVFPFQYLQTATADYFGEGKYCGKYFERTFGVTKIHADGEGTIIMSENDTLYNVLRVYSVNTASIRLNADSCRNDSDNLKQVITERYQWYVRGYRYPVFETVTSSTYNDLNHVATLQHAYMCPPVIQVALDDSINAQIRETDRQLYGNDKQGQSAKGDVSHHEGKGFTYKVLSDGNHFTITYSLDETSHIHAMVVDVMGNIYRDIHQSNSAGSDYSMYFDCTGLRPGQYIIYINVNGSIYNIKISVK